MVSLGRSLIQSMNGKRRTLKRSVDAGYVNGVWNSVVTGVYVMAGVQPATGADIKRLPEGDRAKKVLRVYSADELRVHDEKAGLPADIIIIGQDDFVVVEVERWPNYWKALVVRREQKDNNVPSDYLDGGEVGDIPIYFIDGGTSTAPSSPDRFDGGDITA